MMEGLFFKQSPNTFLGLHHRPSTLILYRAEAASSKFTRSMFPFAFSSASLHVHYESLRSRFLEIKKPLHRPIGPFGFRVCRASLISRGKHDSERNNQIEPSELYAEFEISARLLLNWRLSNTAAPLVIFASKKLCQRSPRKRK